MRIMIRWKSAAYTATITTRKAKYLRRAVRLVRVSPSAKRKPNWLDKYFMARRYVSAWPASRAHALRFHGRALPLVPDDRLAPYDITTMIAERQSAVRHTT